MEAIGIIPARFASTRFPGKPLVDIGGKPMVQRVYEQSMKARSLSGVFIATDDKRIYDAVVGFGGQAIMTSENCVNGTERCAEALEHLNGHFAEVVVNIQGDEPFIQPEDIDNLVSCFADKDVHISTLVKRFVNQADFENPSRVKAIVDDFMVALRFKRNLQSPFSIDHPQVFHHVGLYAFRVSVLAELVKIKPTANELNENLEQLRWLDNAYRIKCVETNHEAWSVDTPEDLERIQLLLKKS
ncbi:MAG: 3-deoxy-manno-octulosonate cytidylyltransferase [Bacteroidetes bacterium]|nr:3-deoxy-manno-octulosonate cytidylyltransferase [Bacteroidota bacterium]